MLLFIKIKSNDNVLVNTDRRLMIFLAWFQNKMKEIKDKVHVYNTSLKGAYIEHTEVSDFNAIMKKYHFKEINSAKKTINNFNPELKNIDYNNFIKDLTEASRNMGKTVFFVTDFVPHYG